MRARNTTIAEHGSKGLEISLLFPTRMQKCTDNISGLIESKLKKYAQFITPTKKQIRDAHRTKKTFLK
jgi:hypothetical protein